MDLKTIERKIQQARTNLVLDQPFFGSLVLRLPCTPDPHSPDKPYSDGDLTAWTDGKEIRYNPHFLDTLSLSQTEGLLCHEVMHCSNGHPWRRDSRDPQMWNMACDYAINPILIDAHLDLPTGALSESRFNGQSAEQIYATLQQEQQDDPNGKGKPKGNGPGEVRDDQGADAPAQKSDWQVATLQAAIAAKKQGKIPAGLDRLIESIKHPKIDWKGPLRRFIQQAAEQDYTWKRPNRRYFPMGLYLPSLYSENLPGISVFFDTSVSMTQEQLDETSAEVRSIWQEMCPAWIEVGYIDSEIARLDRFEAGEEISFNPAGGGGTDFKPAFEHVQHLDTPPACIIYFTDLYGSFPDSPSEIPTLWISFSDQIAPFGETIKY